MHNKFDPGYVSGDINVLPTVTGINRLDFEDGAEIDWNQDGDIRDRVVVELTNDELNNLYAQLTRIVAERHGDD